MHQTVPIPYGTVRKELVAQQMYFSQCMLVKYPTECSCAAKLRRQPKPAKAPQLSLRNSMRRALNVQKTNNNGQGLKRTLHRKLWQAPRALAQPTQIQPSKLFFFRISFKTCNVYGKEQHASNARQNKNRAISQHLLWSFLCGFSLSVSPKRKSQQWLFITHPT